MWQVKLPVSPVNFAKVSSYIVCNLFWKIQNFGSWANKIYQALWSSKSLQFWLFGQQIGMNLMAQWVLNIYSYTVWPCYDRLNKMQYCMYDINGLGRLRLHVNLLLTSVIMPSWAMKNVSQPLRRKQRCKNNFGLYWDLLECLDFHTTILVQRHCEVACWYSMLWDYHMKFMVLPCCTDAVRLSINIHWPSVTRLPTLYCRLP